tara:strand:- start:656 stop:973 length:318 start_codon:yes stop_codon:yes gene_type:complete
MIKICNAIKNKKKQLTNGYLIMDLVISLSLLVLLSTFICFFIISLSPIIIKQRDIIVEIETFHNGVNGFNQKSLQVIPYNNNWQQLILITQSNVKLNALIKHNDK